MKKQPYGEAAKRYALELLALGWQAEQVKQESLCAEIPAATLRSWKSRLQQQNGNAATQTATKRPKKRNVATLATPENNAQREIATPKQEQKTAFNTLETLFLWAKSNPYEIAYYTAVGISCIGIVTALQVVGLAVAVVHALVAFAALQRCKKANATADDLAAVVFSGLAVGVPSDIVWANKAVWENALNLPLRLQTAFIGQQWVGEDIDKPFYIACYIAAFLWVSSISTAWLVLQSAKAAARKV